MKKLAFLMVSLVMLASAPGLAQNGSQIYIKVGEAKVKKSLLAFPPIQFSGSPSQNSNYQKVGTEIYEVLKNDLEASSYFQMVDPKAYLEDTTKTGLKPVPNIPNGFKFQSWQAIGTDFLLRVGYSMSGNNTTLEGYIYHVPRQQLILGRQYRGDLSNTRRIAHTFASDILEALTGKKGMFLSKVAVVSDRGKGDFREVYVMDWDGANANQVSFHNSITVSPAWSPDGKKVSYTAFVKHKKSGKRNADLFVYDLTNTKRWLVSYKDGMNSGSTFHPNGDSIYLTMSSAGGDPEIFQINLEGKVLKQVTSSPKGVLNVEPNISPDGKKMLFSSTRHGNPMIYVKNANGTGDATRLTRVGKYNASAVWSPDGSKIAFAGHQKGHFDIYVMNADGSNIVKLTEAKKTSGKWADNEDPTWSPDGRHIMFVSNRTGKKQLFMINPDGSNERRITMDNHNYTKPKWSPFLD